MARGLGPTSGTRILNADKIRAKLKALAPKIEKRILLGSLGSQAKELLTAVIAATPKDTGHLKDSMQMKMAKRQEGTIGFSVGTGKVPAPAPNTGEWDAFYGRMVEQGTVNMPAQSFMQPTFAAMRPGILTAITKAIHDKLGLVINS